MLITNIQVNLLIYDPTLDEKDQCIKKKHFSALRNDSHPFWYEDEYQNQIKIIIKKNAMASSIVICIHLMLYAISI